MYLIKAFIPPHRLQAIVEALEETRATGLTVSAVRGHGRQRGKSAQYRGAEYRIELLEKLLLEIAVREEQLEGVLQALQKAGNTGRVGAGKLLVLPLENACRIRTNERGYIAL